MKIERPKANKAKIHCRNEFELCYLRHQYLRRVDFNPTEDQMRPYEFIFTHFAKNTYFTYRNLFGTVGMELDDIISIAKVHLISFLGLFAMERLKEKLDEFSYNHVINKGRMPTLNDLLNKNKANFTSFIKQRMEDVVRVCRQKVRNIKGYPAEECYVYCGPTKPPQMLSDLIENYERYGFRKLDLAVFKTIRKRAKAKWASIFKFNNMYYVSVKVNHKVLSIEDFSGAGMDPYDSVHNMSPDRLYFDREQDQFWEEKLEEFEAYSEHKKNRVLQKFIANNKDKPEFKEEIRLARKMLKGNGSFNETNI